MLFDIQTTDFNVKFNSEIEKLFSSSWIANISPEHTSQVQKVEKKGGETTRPESNGNKSNEIPCKDLVFFVVAFECISNAASSNESFFLVRALHPVNNTTVHENWSKENTTDTTTIMDSECIYSKVLVCA